MTLDSFWFAVGFVSICASSISGYAVKVKAMLRQPRFFILACFLLAIASNFIQATYISVSQATSEHLLSTAPDGEQSTDSVFIVPDDDSDDTPTLILVQTPLEDIQSSFLNSHLNVSPAVTDARTERHTVLRL